MKLIENSSYGYQILNHSRKTVTECSSNEKKLNVAIFLKDWALQNNHLYGNELVKTHVEHAKRVVFGYFLLQYAKLVLLVLYCRFFDRCCNISSFKEQEMDPKFFYNVFDEKDPKHCIRPEMKAAWVQLRFNVSADTFAVDTTVMIIPRFFCAKHGKDDKRGRWRRI